MARLKECTQVRLKVQSFLAALTLLVASLNSISLKAEPTYDNSNRNPYIYRNRLTPIFAYSLEDMLRLIESEKISSIEELIPALPESFRTRYMLMYRSRSLQQASFLYPRVLMLGEDASFVLTFNGEPRQRGYDKLEMMQFRPETSSFEFRELEFVDGKTKLSEANPAKCLKCHQSPERRNVDPRPNWEPYNVWPGAYGSLNGNFYSGVREHKNKQFDKNPADKIIYEQSLLEHENLKLFETTVKPQNPRYSHLGEFRPHITVESTMYFANLNFRRVARLLSENLEWDRYKWLVALTTKDFGCQGLSQKDLFKQSVKSLYTLQEASYRRKNTQDWQDKTRKFDNISTVIELLMLSRGVETSDWSMDFRTNGRLAFRERFGTPNAPRSDFNRALSAVFPELADVKCEDVMAKVKELFNSEFLYQERQLLLHYQQKSSQELETLRRPQATLQSCARCHVGTEDPLSALAPRIPFDNLYQLAVKLNEPGYPRGTLRDEMIFRVGSHASLFEQMPPDSSLRTEEVDALTQYLKDL